jgi:hypothetical protein
MAKRETERDLAFIIDRRCLVPPVLPMSDCAATTQSRPSPDRGTEKRERDEERHRSGIAEREMEKDLEMEL